MLDQSLGNQESQEGQETQKVIHDQQSELENQLSLEANSKLVQDLKTISAVIESKKPAILPNDIPLDKPDLLYQNTTQPSDSYLSQTADATQ